MEILRLYIEDFCGHQKTEIDFSKFSSALIIGSVDGDFKISNGSGKSTIFSAIEYVLFNETRFSNLDKIIRDNCDFCRVSAEILIDDIVYKVIRSRSRKSGSDLRLFKKNNEWEDITQRRITDNEKELLKLIKINYKTFIASVLFSQSKSDTSAQLDYSDFCFISSEKRRSALKEILQLNIYNKFENTTKKKITEISKELDKNKIILSTIGDPLEDIKEFFVSKKEIEKNLNEKQLHLDIIIDNFNELNNNLNSIKYKINEIENNNKNYELSLKSIEKEIFISNKNIEDYKNKINEIKLSGKILSDELKKYSDIIEKYENEKKDISFLKKEELDLTSSINKISSKISLLKEKLVEKNIPLPNGDVCKHCRQTLSKEHLNKCKIDLENDKKELLDQIKVMEKIYDKECSKKSELLLNIKKEEDLFIKTNEYKNLIAVKNKELFSKRSLYSEYTGLLENSNKVLKEKNKDLLDIKEKINNSFENELNNLKFLQKEILIKIQDASKDIDKTKKEFDFIKNKKTILDHKIEEREKDLNKNKLIKQTIIDLEKKLLLHQKVSQAFGSNGIPSLIIHTVLDELQIDTNNYLSMLKPEIQLQFVLVKNKSNGDQDDILEINYFIKGIQREYRQLSGAQKVMTALSVKLGILSVLRSKLGVNIKFLLLDEVDQALDENSQESFFDSIRFLQKYFKILVITHNNDFKNKFAHAIVVEQKDNISHTKLLGW